MFFELAFVAAMSVPAASLPVTQNDLIQVDYILPAERVVVYPPEGVVRRVTNSALSVPAQTVFDTEFVTATYYGAFATTKDGGWGYSVGANSLDGAREVAMQQCLFENLRCLITAELVPVGYVEIGPGDVTIAPAVVGHYTDVTTNVAPFAMAVSADGAYSKVWEMPSQAAADAAALSDCEGYRFSDLPNLPPFPCVLLPRPRK